jgi:hypothetical protein
MTKYITPSQGHHCPRTENNYPKYGNRTDDHAQRVSHFAGRHNIDISSTQTIDLDYLLDYCWNKTHIPLTITRTQWAVGPGFFHSGTIRSNNTQFTYVYDCGTARSFKLLQNEVDTYLSSLRSTWPARRIIDKVIHKYIEHYYNCPYHSPYFTPYDLASLHFPDIFNFHLTHMGELTFSGTPFKTEWEPDRAQTTQQAQVDIVFISHFDTDHIKGLAYLIQNAVIKEVAIPFTTLRERFLHLCKSTFNGGNDYNQVITDQYSDFILSFTADPATAIRRVPQLLDSGQREITLTVIPHESENKEEGNHDFIRHVNIHTNHHLTDNIHDTSESTPVWLFTASTLQGNEDELGEELINTLINEGIIKRESDLKNTDKLRNIFGDKASISKVATTYRKICGRQLNQTSLILHSGPAHPEESPALHHAFWRGEPRLNHYNTFEINSPWETGWLGCGDANLKEVDNVDIFDRLFWQQKLFTSTFAPPHHGSQKDWNEHLLDAFGFPTESVPVCVFSADGLHKHPSPNVIADANSRGSTTYVVTTELKSRLTETLLILVPTDYDNLHRFH